MVGGRILAAALLIVLASGCMQPQQEAPPEAATSSTAVAVQTSITETQTPVRAPETTTTAEAAPKESCSDGMLNQDEKGIDCGGVCPPCRLEAKAPFGYTPSSYWIYDVTEETPGKEPQEFSYMYEYVGEQNISEGTFVGFDIVPISLGDDNEIVKMDLPSTDYYTITGGKVLVNMYRGLSSNGKTRKDKYDPAYTYLDFPLQVGAQWGGSYEKHLLHSQMNLGSLDVNYSTKVSRQEEVSTPAGTFNTFVIDTTSYISVGPEMFETVSETIWYSPEVGRYVKYVQINDLEGNQTEIEVAPRRGSRVIFDEYNWTEQLSKYALGKA